MKIIEVKNIYKNFGQNKVLDDISFSVEEGQILGFLGRNGVGKTTTIKIILGLLKADKGEVYVCGEKVEFGVSKTNKHIGYLPDVPEFYNYMTAKKYLEFCKSFSNSKNNRDISELLKIVGLENSKKNIGKFSLGMKQRLGIAAALLNNPKLLICDEPTSALDPLGRNEILDIISKAGITVIFSTHILSDVEKICSSFCILNDGKIVEDGNIKNLKTIPGTNLLTIELLNENKSFVDNLKKLEFIKEINVTEGIKIDVMVTSIENDMKRILKEIIDYNVQIKKIYVQERDLNSIFMEVIK